MPLSRAGLFSGAIFDACPPKPPIEANVGIGGQHACVFAAKGPFTFQNLPLACALVVTATKPGHGTVVISPAGSTLHIALERLAGTCTDPPALAPCVCDAPTCVLP